MKCVRGLIFVCVKETTMHLQRKHSGESAYHDVLRDTWEQKLLDNETL